MKYYDYQKGKLALIYEVELRDNMYLHTLSVHWNNNLTGQMTLYNKKKKPNIYQFFESLELVDRHFFKTNYLQDEWGDVIREFDEQISNNKK